MPSKPVRKRGKKPSKRKQDHPEAQPSSPASQVAVPSDPAPASTNSTNDEPDWVRSQPSSSNLHTDQRASDAPFGLVDTEVKAYFRQVWTTLQDLEAEGYRASNTVSQLQGSSVAAEGVNTEDDQLALLIKAILSEMDGKELVLATDPDTSFVIEGLVQRIGQKPLRVLLDRMAGHYPALASHRFGSHVLQTCLAYLQPVITAENARDAKGKARSLEIVSEQGVLRSATHIFLGLCSELEEKVQQMAADSFASHVLRSTLLLLSGQLVCDDRSAAAGIRSKRSAHLRRKKGTAPADPSQDSIARPSAETPIAIPSGFLEVLRSLKQAGFAGLDADDVRSLATDPVASPVLQLYMSLEGADLQQQQQQQGGQDGELWRHSLTDTVLDGLVTATLDGQRLPTRSDHLESSLRDSVASHALQLALSLAPSRVVDQFYQAYVAGRLAQLGSHPSARYVVIEAIRRLDSEATVGAMVEELNKVGESLVKQSALGLLQAVLERCGALEMHEGEAARAVLAAFRLDDTSEGVEKHARLVLPVILSGKTRKAYLKLLANGSGEGEDGKRGKGGIGKGKNKGKDQGKGKDKKRKRGDAEPIPAAEDASQPDEEDKDAETAADARGADASLVDTATLPESHVSVAGSLLLQTLLRLSSPHNDAVLSSLLQQPSLLIYALHPVGVHVVLTALSSPTVPYAQRRRLVVALSPTLRRLADDKWGSRVADLLWNRADGFTKEKLTATLQTQERHLLSSYYGAFFLRKLQLNLFRKSRAEWRDALAKVEKVPLLPSLAEESRSRKGASSDRVVVVQDEEEEGAGGKEDGGEAPDERKGHKRKRQKVDRVLDEILAGI